MDTSSHKINKKQITPEFIERVNESIKYIANRDECIRKAKERMKELGITNTAKKNWIAE